MKIRRKQPQQPASNGWHAGILVAIDDLGIRATPWGPQAKISMRFLLDEKDAAGQNIRVSKMYNPTATSGSAFYMAVEAITGKPPVFDSHDDLETNELCGTPCQVQTQQRVTSKGTFANVTGLRPAAPGQPAIAIPLAAPTVHKPNGRQHPATRDTGTEFSFPAE
jgi:hypothetical protein